MNCILAQTVTSPVHARMPAPRIDTTPTTNPRIPVKSITQSLAGFSVSKPKHQNQKMGIYYQRPDGEVVFAVSIKPKSMIIMYAMANSNIEHRASFEEFQTWTPKPELLDYPNSKDPKLPIVFKVNWKMNRHSELKTALEKGHPELESIKACIQKTGFKL